MTTPPLPLPRRLAYSAFAAVGALLFLEIAARQVEARWPASPPTPLPSPQGMGCATCLPGAAQPPAGSAHLPIQLVWSDDAGAWVASADGKPGDGALAAVRGDPPPTPKPPEEWRLVTVGDSSVWGDGVPTAGVFSSVAAQALSSQTGRPVRALIAAQPGHTTARSLSVLRSVGPQLDPDVVLIGNLWSDLFHRASPAFVEPPGAQAPWALYRLSLRLLAPLLPQGTVGWIDPDRGTGMPAAGASPQTSLDDYRANLGALADQARALGATPAFLLLAAPIDQDPSGVPPFITEYRAVMRQVAQEEDAVLVDAVAGFEEAGVGPAHFFDAVHPSAAGHALLGELTASALAPLLAP